MQFVMKLSMNKQGNDSRKLRGVNRCIVGPEKLIEQTPQLEELTAGSGGSAAEGSRSF